MSVHVSKINTSKDMNMDDNTYSKLIFSNPRTTTGALQSGAEQGEGFRRYRRAAVCLGLLGLVLLGVAAGLCIKYRTERDQILNRYTGLAEDLLANYSSLVKERDQLSSLRSMLEAKVTQLEKFEFNCRIFQSATEDTWNMSRKYCREKGGDLVMIKSKKKQTVLNEMRLNGWIGLSDESEEGKWTWVDTTKVNTTFWGKGQPDNPVEVDEDCAVFHFKDNDPLSTWHDHECSSKHLAICEKSCVCV
ncbi:hepatic lectin-like [Denticeps clupeoides]|uniref:hepatic lectin-like n=1 Tax=Denticeps clupeoides TaxID=299321 RepID=UPI0010A3E479|nr:hepatic lectin-like [Denticeps clupeoides]